MNKFEEMYLKSLHESKKKEDGNKVRQGTVHMNWHYTCPRVALVLNNSSTECFKILTEGIV